MMDNPQTKFNIISSICNNIESKYKTTNKSFTDIKNKLNLLGYGYIEISDLIDKIIELNDEISVEMKELEIALIEYNTELRAKINKLENETKELKGENKVLKDDKQQLEIYYGLSDIYREYNYYIKEMLDKYVIDLPKELRLDLNSIIPAYKDYLRYIERKSVPLYVQELKDIILNNIQKWYYEYINDEWNWEFFIWLHDISSERNSISHLFHNKTDKETYKDNLKKFEIKINNKEVSKSIYKLDTYKDYIIEFIEYELSKN